jgi:hypothetical protein
MGGLSQARTMKMSDRAIADRADDILGRWGIAKTIYDLIADTRTDSALRIGVYGGWGEGKTCVLRFVETLTVKAKIPVCWFSVWSAQTQPDLWAGLYDAFAVATAEPDRWKVKAWAGKAAAKPKASRTCVLYRAAHSLAKLASRTGRKARDLGLAPAASSFSSTTLIASIRPWLKLLMGLHDLFDELGQAHS